MLWVSGDEGGGGGRTNRPGELITSCNPPGETGYGLPQKRPEYNQLTTVEPLLLLIAMPTYRKQNNSCWMTARISPSSVTRRPNKWRLSVKRSIVLSGKRLSSIPVQDIEAEMYRTVEKNVFYFLCNLSIFIEDKNLKLTVGYLRIAAKKINK